MFARLFSLCLIACLTTACATGGHYHRSSRNSGPGLAQKKDPLLGELFLIGLLGKAVGDSNADSDYDDDSGSGASVGGTLLLTAGIVAVVAGAVYLADVGGDVDGSDPAKPKAPFKHENNVSAQPEFVRVAL